MRLFIFFVAKIFLRLERRRRESIYDVLGENCLEKIHKDPKILNEVPNLAEKKIAIIKKGIRNLQVLMRRMPNC